MQSPSKLRILYCSDVFLHEKRQRAALALLYDIIFLPSLTTHGPGCSNIYWDGMSYEQITKRVLGSDALLGQEQVIRRVAAPDDGRLSVPDVGMLVAAGRRLQHRGPDPLVERVKEQYGVDEPLLLFLANTRAKISSSLAQMDLGQDRLAVNALVEFLLHFWNETLAPRFFIDNLIFSVPLAVEDITLLYHEEVLSYFIPDVGNLEDEDILRLRNLTASERLGYLARVLELISEMQGVRNMSSMSELRRFLSDQVKLKIVPAFVDYASSLRAQKKARAVRCIDDAVRAFTVKGSVTEPRYWVNVLRSLLGALRGEQDTQAYGRPVDKHFMAYVARISAHGDASLP